MAYTLAQLIVAGEIGKVIQVFTEPLFPGAPPYTLTGTVTIAVLNKTTGVSNSYSATIGATQMKDLAGNVIAQIGQWASFVTDNLAFPTGGPYEMKMTDVSGGQTIISAYVGVQVNP